MKKSISFVFVLLFVVVGAFAEDVDFSGMSQAEILDIINAGRNALVLQEMDDGLLRYDTEQGIVIIFTRFNDRFSLNKYHFVEVVIVNDTDIDYKIRCDNLYINGWKCDSLVPSDINAYRRMNDEWGFVIADANLESLDEITEIEFYLTIYPVNGRAKDALIIPPAVIILNNND